MSARRIRKILIIGGGIAGPAVGMWLRRAGFEVDLAEARDDPQGTAGAFLGVAPNGMRVLDDLGIAPSVAAMGVACHEFAFLNGQGRPIGHIDRRGDAAAFGWPLTMIRRADLHQTLWRLAGEHGVRMAHGRRLVGLDDVSPGPVLARFADGTTQAADVVLGCDGIESHVRHLLLPDAAPPRALGLLDCGGFAQGVDIDVPVGTNAMIFGRRAFFGAFPAAPGAVWWFHNGPWTDTPLGPSALRARLLDLHRNDLPWIAKVIDATPDLLGPWSLRALDSLAPWHAGRVCLLGDAAHAMSPSAGQGASLALEDGIVLAQCLRDIDDPPAAFSTFERRRRARVEAIARIARRSGSGKAVSNGAARWLRDRMLPLFLRLGAKAQTEGYAYGVAWEG